MSSIHCWLGAVGAALVLAAPMSAQEAVPTNVGVAPAVAAVQVSAPAPTQASAAFRVNVTSLTAPVAATPLTDPAAAPLPAQGSQSTNVAMMIVGGAALVVGSLIDGDTGTIVMVGGGVVGLIGLFRYLR